MNRNLFVDNILTRLFRISPVLFGIIAATGCGPSHGSSSSTQGHYENSDALDQAPYINQQVAIPEHYESQSVIVGLPILTAHHREDLIQAILDAGAQKVHLVVNPEYRNDLKQGDPLAHLQEALGTDFNRVNIVENQVPGELTVWARDWTPLFTRSNDGGELRMLDMNYYINRPSDDFVPRTLEKDLGLKRMTIPVYNEGGNFMVNGKGECLMTDRVSRANRRRYSADDMLLDEPTISNFFQSFAGCRRVLIFPKMPFELTGHIDVWAKYLNDSTIAVAEMQDKTIAVLNPISTNYRMAVTLKSFLDARAAEIEKFGFHVVRLPMPAPYSDKDDILPTYVNSLTVNQTVIVPRYVAMPPQRQQSQTASIPYDDAALFPEYEKEVTETLAKFGYKTTFIEADSIIQMGGSIHCVTMQVGNPAFKSAVAEPPVTDTVPQSPL